MDCRPDAVIATFGEPLLRLSVGVGRRLGRVNALDVAVGGAELNVATALAGLGRRTRYISAVPDSPLGERVLRELSSHGVAVDHVQKVPDSRLGLYFVEHAAPPRAHRVSYDRSGTAFAEAAFTAANLDGVDMLVISGITPALGAGPAAQVSGLVAAAAQRGIPIVLDVNYRALLWTAAEATAVLAPLLRAADIVICAARDAAILFDSPTARALRDIHAPQARLVVTTDGSNGAAAVGPDGECSASAPATAIVDRFGAGDGFTAGLLWSLAAGDDPQQALSAGTALAAMACTVDGDIAAFTEHELRSVIGDPAAVMLR